MRTILFVCAVALTAQSACAQSLDAGDHPGDPDADRQGLAQSWLTDSGRRIERVWVSAEYLLWSIRPAETPPLLTTGPQSTLGTLGAPGTVTLFGGTVPFPLFSGGRFSAGTWFDCQQTCGIEGSFFFLGQNSTQFSEGSGGDPVLSRPFINALTGKPWIEQVANLANPADPLLIPLTGRATITMPSQLWGAELNGVRNLCRSCFCGGGYSIDLLGGFRFLSLREGLTIEEDLRVPDSSILIPGTTFRVIDSFSTQNNFYGGQLGARVRLDYRAWELAATGKLAMGVTEQQCTISGSTLINEPGLPPQSFNTGILASTSNIGNYSRDVFSVVPEIDLRLGYRLSDQLKVFAGYTFLFWSDVARPGDQVDLRLNPHQIPGSGLAGGPALPAFSFHGTSFWAQGVSLGLAWRY